MTMDSWARKCPTMTFYVISSAAVCHEHFRLGGREATGQTHDDKTCIRGNCDRLADNLVCKVFNFHIWKKEEAMS